MFLYTFAVSSAISEFSGKYFASYLSLSALESDEVGIYSPNLKLLSYFNSRLSIVVESFIVVNHI